MRLYFVQAHRSMLCRVSCLLAVSLPCVAQSSSADQLPALKPNPLIALRDFEGPANQEYTLGPGDEIAIDFSNRTELNSKRILGPDGRITLAPAGAISVVDQTREQAAASIAAALKPFYTGLAVTVGVDKYTSNRVLLLGAVDRPGLLTFDAPPTLLEVLSIGGGLSRTILTSGLLASAAQPARLDGAVPERCAIYRGSEQVLWVDVKGLIDSGSSLADLRLRRGDIVYVPSPTERSISVLGQVQHPGALLLQNDTTLAKLLAEAGGLTVQAGHNPAIQVVSPSTGKSRTVKLSAVLQPGPLDLQLNSGDVVFVTESGFNQASYVLEKLSPLISIFTTAALLNQTH